MSFAGEVKEELLAHEGKARHCKLAELAALFVNGGQIIPEENNRVILKFSTENLTVAKKYSMLVKKVFGFPMECSVRSSGKEKNNHQYCISVLEQSDVKKMMKALKILDEGGNWILGNSIVNGLLVQETCCKRAFIRGMFLAAGSVTNPSRGYHFEIVAGSKSRAQDLQRIICAFAVDAKITTRKKNYIVYIKEGSQIVDVLNIMGAHVALMKLENVRILKEMRNSINRQVNCETANIQKVVSAATKQTDDIYYIKEQVGFGRLSEGLAAVAQLRVEHPEASLKELGEMLNPPIGKSGVNHRLRKLSEFARELRQHKEEKL